MKRLLGVAVVAALVFGAVTVITPPPQAAPGDGCIVCPQIFIECGPCYQLVPQTCKRCAHCKRIPGCQEG